jgi:shikimate kinase
VSAPVGPVRHVAVVGLMGAGKSTVGRLVAGDLAWPLHDSDADIEAAQGRTVRELGAEIGIDAMHDLEAEQLLGALAVSEPSVVCPAASVADVPRCREALADPSVAVIWVRADPTVAASRFARGGHRPSYGDDPAEFLARQATARYPHFEALADIRLDTDRESPRILADRALVELRRLGAVREARGE